MSIAIIDPVVSVGIARNGATGHALHEVAPDMPSRPAWPRTEFCLSAGVDTDPKRQIQQLLTKRVRIRKGQALYRVGCDFKALIVLRTGACKTFVLARDGRDQVTGYHIAGDIVGMDGIGADAHECEASALEDMDVCPLPFDAIEDLARISAPFRHNLYGLLARESARHRSMMMLLGSMRAEQRLAVFLLDLSCRYHALGYSSHEFVLRMSRTEIASYLGLKLETVSRILSRFRQEGLIRVQQRTISLIDREAVCRIVEGGTISVPDANIDARSSVYQEPPRAARRASNRECPLSGGTS